MRLLLVRLLLLFCVLVVPELRLDEEELLLCVAELRLEEVDVRLEEVDVDLFDEDVRELVVLLDVRLLSTHETVLLRLFR